MEKFISILHFIALVYCSVVFITIIQNFLKIDKNNKALVTTSKVMILLQSITIFILLLLYLSR